MRAIVLFLALALAGCSGKSLPVSVPPVDDSATAAAPLSWWSRAAMNALLRLDVWRGERSGYVALFARDGQPVFATSAGWADIEGAVPMTLDTRMRFASMTKPMTAVAALQLVEQGRLGLDDPVSQYVPAFANARVAVDHSRNADGEFETVPADPVPTVRHLLMFASGVGPGRGKDSDLIRTWQDTGPRSDTVSGMDDWVDQLAQLPLFEQPGTLWRYGWSADVLARVVGSGQRPAVCRVPE